MGLSSFNRMRRAAELAEKETMPPIDIDAMKRGDLVKALVSHGVDKAETKGVSVDVLRQNLKNIMLIG